jgi:Mg-chelatase subunit ChlD
MIAIEEFVRGLGRGLVVMGGRDSYLPGGYEGTPLERLLPLLLEPPPREERPPVALLLLVDHSGSMVEDREEVASRLTMAKEAAIRATDILGPEDLIGIMMFDNRFEWVVPFGQVNDGAELLQIQQSVARIPGGGGTRILQALETALPELMDQDSAIARHAVLFTDGKSFDGGRTIVDYNRVVDEAVDSNITLSTIAIGGDADVDLLSHLAERGRGRYHFADTPEELPALTISESDILRSDALQEGEFAPAISAPHPIVRGIFSPLPVPDRAPAPGLSGYLAMTPRPEAEVALKVGPDDPLLAVWGYGLGRVAAWSSDTGQEWTAAWSNWSEFDRFLGQVVGYTVPAPNLGLLQLDTSIEQNDTIVLGADGVSPAGQSVELARTEAMVTTPGGTENQLLLRQVGPGRYERSLRLPDTGAYQLVVTQTRADEPEETAKTGFVLPYAAEYALPAADMGQPLLEQIAASTGGKAFSLGESLRAGSPAPDDGSEAVEPVELWPWLLLIALGLWPLEIAWRRWGRLRIH